MTGRLFEMRPDRRQWAALLLALAAMGLAPWFAGRASGQELPTRTVLLMYPQEQEMAWYSGIDHGLRSTLQASSSYEVEFYSEYLDLVRFSEGRQVDGLAEYLRVKYRGRKIDLIVVVSSLTLQFLIDRGEQLFPGVPVLFTSVNSTVVQQLTLRPNITGVAVQRSYGDTLDLILRLQSDTREVIVPVGASPRERAWGVDQQVALKPFETRVRITYLNDLRMSQLLDRLRHLPPHTVVLFSALFYSDAAGRSFLPDEALRLVCEAANVPVYGTDAHHLGSGIVGGALYDMEAPGLAAGRMARRILDGESVERITVETLNPTHNMFDVRQLARWGISERSLPPDSVVFYRTASVWDLYKRYIIGFVALLFLQGSLILTLASQARRLRRSEVQLRNLSARLITAQDDERKRIARELHDDFGQRVAALRIDLGMLAREDNSATHVDADTPLQHILTATDELATDLRELSHALHSSRLQLLGLPAALEELCSGIAKQQGIAVALTNQVMTVPVPSDVALCLYRVAQEALHNAAAHGAAPTIDVTLSHLDTRLEMRIVDTGKGFDYAQVSEGLGLASMRERLKMIGGELRVHSKPGQGTSLIALVDLRLHPAAARSV
jgi:signal transduction histidine kinase